MAGFACLLFNKNTFFASSMFICGWIMYFPLTTGQDASYYYAASAGIELSIGYILNNKYRLVAYINYTLIFVNIYGLLLFKMKVSPISYDIIYALLSVTQFLILIIRANLNGIYRLPEQCWLVRLLYFDSRQTRVIMCKSKTTKEANR